MTATIAVQESSTPNPSQFIIDRTYQVRWTIICAPVQTGCKMHPNCTQLH
jgi:hypothetical protein